MPNVRRFVGRTGIQFSGVLFPGPSPYNVIPPKKHEIFVDFDFDSVSLHCTRPEGV
jgi:hypothetical protein